MSGNHKRKRRDSYTKRYSEAVHRLFYLLDTLGLKSCKHRAFDSQGNWYSYCLKIYERRRKEQRL